MNTLRINYLKPILLLYFLTACTPKANPEHTDQRQASTQMQKLKVESQVLDSDFLNFIKFTGQVELEVFKIINPQFKNTQKIPSQLYILSQLLQLKVDPQSLPPATSIFYNCYKIELVIKEKNKVEVLRTCEAKKSSIALLHKTSSNDYLIHFYQSQWSSVIGDSALLNQKDKTCRIKVEDKKVQEFSCENTLLTSGAGTSLEEIRLSRYSFSRTGKKQIEVVGGRYKDFTERSKINIVVPEEGKIHFNEIELHVKDDFAEEMEKAKSTENTEQPQGR